MAVLLLFIGLLLQPTPEPTARAPWVQFTYPSAYRAVLMTENGTAAVETARTLNNFGVNARLPLDLLVSDYADAALGGYDGSEVLLREIDGREVAFYTTDNRAVVAVRMDAGWAVLLVISGDVPLDTLQTMATALDADEADNLTLAMPQTWTAELIEETASVMVYPPAAVNVQFGLGADVSVLGLLRDYLAITSEAIQPAGLQLIEDTAGGLVARYEPSENSRIWTFPVGEATSGLVIVPGNGATATEADFAVAEGVVRSIVGVVDGTD